MSDVIEKGSGEIRYPHLDLLLTVGYEYHGYKNGDGIVKYPKVTNVKVGVKTTPHIEHPFATQYDITEIVDHNVVETIKTFIFKELNETYTNR